jgi:hypothetical protein
MLECAAYCAMDKDSALPNKYADCLDACAGSMGYPIEMDLLNDWYTCLCVDSCKPPCESVQVCP